MTTILDTHISNYAFNRIIHKGFKLRKILLKSRILSPNLTSEEKELFVALIYYEGENETGFMFSYPFTAANIGAAIMQISNVYVNR